MTMPKCYKTLLKTITLMVKYLELMEVFVCNHNDTLDTSKEERSKQQQLFCNIATIPSVTIILYSFFYIYAVYVQLATLKLYLLLRTLHNLF